MTAKLFCYFRRIFPSNGHLNYHAFNRNILLDTGQKSVNFLRCRLCTNVSLIDNASLPLDRVPQRKELEEKQVRKDKVKWGNFTDYADRSPIVQTLIDLGVEVYKFNNNRALCEFLMNLDFDRDVKPYLMFLQNIGVPVDKFGEYLTKNPYILQCDMDDLVVRLNYLESKKFTHEAILHIITKNPKWLSYDVVYIDTQLGNVQTALELTGDEVRSLVYKFPGIVSVKKHILTMNMFTFKEELGVDMKMCKDLLLNEPRLLKIDNRNLLNTLDYLLYNMSVPIHQIIKEPTVLSCRAHIIGARHKFLHRLGRAQYNPKMPGYVSLTDLVRLSDEEFCNKLARTSVLNFYKFQKML